MTKPLPIPDFTDIPRYPQDKPTEWENDTNEGVDELPSQPILKKIFNWFIKNKGER